MPNRFEGIALRIANLAESTDVLDGFEFRNCTLIGPAVLLALSDIAVVANTFDGDFDALLWEIPVTRRRIIGAIGLRNCSFIGCTFQRIGFAGSPEFIAAFRRGSAQVPSVTPAPAPAAPATPPASAAPPSPAAVRQ